MISAFSLRVSTFVFFRASFRDDEVADRTNAWRCLFPMLSIQHALVMNSGIFGRVFVTGGSSAFKMFALSPVIASNLPL